MDIVRSVNNVPIRLTDERWGHILDGHAELTDRRDRVLLTVGEPHAVARGRAGALLAFRRESDGKWLVVTYREINATDGFVITAYLTKRDPSARRQTLWTRP